MSPTPPAWLVWTPRVLALAYAGFLGLFALDVFERGRPVGQQLAAFVLHLLPSTGVVLLVLAAAWRWPLVGAVAYPLLGLAYIVAMYGRMHWTAHLFIAGPLLLLGLLFALSRR